MATANLSYPTSTCEVNPIRMGMYSCFYVNNGGTEQAQISFNDHNYETTQVVNSNVNPPGAFHSKHRLF